VAGLLLDFFRQRWSAIREAEGVRPDEIQAVTSVGFDDAVDAGRRLAALRGVRRLPDFEPLAAAFKRAMNIVKQAGMDKEGGALPVREDLMSDPAEKDLFHAYLNLRERTGPLRAESRYEELLPLLARLRDPVDRFFKDVMVMAPDPAVKGNRVALLANLSKLFLEVVDLSRLQESSS
jgi:glycyl-tRNA synthetase beta chain